MNGLLSTYTTKFGEYFDFYGGVDLRYYKGLHQNIIVDLFSGSYFVDSNRTSVKVANNSAASNPGFAKEKLGVGDVIYRDYDGFVLSEGGFAQLEYNRDKLAAFVAGGLSNTSYWRYDRFYYDAEHAKSDVVSFWGYTAKGGANYNINDNHNVFANIGYISRAPFFSSAFSMASLRPKSAKVMVSFMKIRPLSRWNDILSIVTKASQRNIIINSISEINSSIKSGYTPALPLTVKGNVKLSNQSIILL